MPHIAIPEQFDGRTVDWMEEVNADRLPAIPAAHHMVHRAGILDAHLPWHGARLTPAVIAHQAK